ncbi:hypothetical protein A6V36_20010 [Paraburkholderia ginsengiterrae]|uniref:PAAR domain-containing protein n=1 Tax=Paraburkholderia ginsengiterrae TaxID=1462993 RepID=A0A1A9MYV7_9BURK|nr:PAAR domain-containing protein [Paraburkholderia ginsengiterrae]OAJ52872.1 hypothetical protein A6V37_36360 [Paraburkholderia ginsengiterrae]OAJ63119.1 hypothetical protein A6V36_20010 [Paraburkholderia ginsengiterrae]
MIRYFLAKGDRGGSAMITEGLDSVTCSNPPPRVQIATLYMKTYCTACKQEGYIAPRGPRWPGTAVNGKEWALSGDINICGCNPPPIFYAERGMSMSFTSEQVAALTGNGTSVAERQTQAAQYDEQVRTVSRGTRIDGYPYFIKAPDGQIHSGRITANGLLPRINTSDADEYVVYWGDEALAHEEWR